MNALTWPDKSTDAPWQRILLVELIEFKSPIDEETGEALLAEQLRLWIDRVVDEVEAHYMWPELTLGRHLEREKEQLADHTVKTLNQPALLES